MSIYTAQGRFYMAKSFYQWASGFGTGMNVSPLWMGIGRSSPDPESDDSWKSLIPTIDSPHPEITEDRPPNPLLYPGPYSKTITQANISASPPVGYYQNPSFLAKPKFYKRISNVQYVYETPNGQIPYLNNNYSAYDDESEARLSDCNLVFLSVNINYYDLTALGITPENFAPRQQGVYANMPSLKEGGPNAGNPINDDMFLVSDEDCPNEQNYGLMLINNIIPVPYVEYQARIASYIVRF